MKRQLKRAVQGVTSLVAPTWWSLRRSPSLLILMYHRVLPPGHPERASEQPGMYISPDTLALHVELLKQHFTLVHLDDWIAAQEQGKSMPRSCCALTFDDGWLDNYQHAYPILKRAGAPATIYLVSDLVGTSYAFWPNRLARILADRVDESVIGRFPPALAVRVRQCVAAAPAGSAGLDSQTIDTIVGECKSNYTDAEMIESLDQLDGHAEHAAATRDLMDWNEIRTMAADDQIRFGSHSRRHTRLLSQLSAAVTEDEVIGSQSVIEEQLGKRPNTFCYPNGDFSPAAVAAVRGRYAAAVTTRRGWNSRDNDRYLLNRVGVHEDVSNSRISFLSRLAGVG